MKINEFKKKQVNEGLLSALIGDFGAASLKSMFSNMSRKDIMEKDIFMRTFFGLAENNLESAIQSGFVNPKIKGSTSTTPQTTSQPATEPNEPASSPAATAGKNVPGQPVQTTTAAPAVSPATQASYDDLAQIRKQKQGAAIQDINRQFAAQTPSGVKPVSAINRPAAPAQPTAPRPAAPATATQRPAAPAQPTAQRPVAPATATQRPAAPNYGVRQPSPGQVNMPATKAQPTIATAPAKPGPKAPVTPTARTPYAGSSARERLMTKRAYQALHGVKENKFDSLNEIFEQIINIPENQLNEQTGRSISDHMKMWFMKNMGLRTLNTDAQEYLNQLVLEIEKSYPNISGPLNKLAYFAWALSKSDSDVRLDPKLASSVKKSEPEETPTDTEKTKPTAGAAQPKPTAQTQVTPATSDQATPTATTQSTAPTAPAAGTSPDTGEPENTTQTSTTPFVPPAFQPAPKSKTSLEPMRLEEILKSYKSLTLKQKQNLLDFTKKVLVKKNEEA